MFDYPKKAEFNRVVPKAKVYDYGKPSRAVWGRFCFAGRRDRLEIQAFPGDHQPPGRQGTQEIQVFAIALKTGELNGDVLRTLDKSLPSPIFYELTFEDHTQVHRRLQAAQR
jgi:hypothetical protein